LDRIDTHESRDYSFSYDHTKLYKDKWYEYTGDTIRVHDVTYYFLCSFDDKFNSQYETYMSLSNDVLLLSDARHITVFDIK
jgi:hypothetical protein